MPRNSAQLLLISVAACMLTQVLISFSAQQEYKKHEKVAPSSHLLLAPDTQQAPADFPVVDIISVGTDFRPEYQDSQEKTFGSHQAVRNFYRITERDDTSEPRCSHNLTMNTIERVLHYCKKRPKRYDVLDRIKRLYTDKNYLLKHSNPIGWMCAQKRPIDAFYAQLQKYESNAIVFPDYLLITDDDTWVNIDLVLPFLLEHHPPFRAHAITGCMGRMRNVNFTFAFGGYGTVYTREVLKAWIRPIACESNWSASNEQSALACSRLEENLAGEQHLFRNGMSAVDIMYSYAKDQSLADFANWNPTGFCMHSDVTMAYFLNYYHLSTHSSLKKFAEVDVDRLQGYNGSHYYVGRQTPGQRSRRQQCLHKNNDACGVDAHFCHYITPEHMETLHRGS